MTSEVHEIQGMCESCPFGGSYLAEQAVNWGCVPSPQEIMEIKSTTEKNWTCHHDEEKICPGFVNACREAEVSYRGSEKTTYDKWYYGKEL